MPLPSEIVKAKGAVPVKLITIVAEPLHIVCVPLKTEVGRDVTVTTALPVRFPGTEEVQVASLSADTERAGPANGGASRRTHGASLSAHDCRSRGRISPGR